MVELFANSGDPDQMPHSGASDLGLHCLPITFKVSPDYNGLKKQQILFLEYSHSLELCGYLRVWLGKV